MQVYSRYKLFMNRIKLTSTILIPLTLALSSCGNSMDLTTAKNLAKTGNDANKVFQNIANDVYESCLRQARYTPLQRSTQRGIDQDRRTVEESCEKEPKNVKKSLDIANGIIINYLQALGKLAADDLTTYDSQLDSLGTSFKELKLPPKEVDAGSGIAKFLFKIATEKYRRKQLKSVVTSTDSNLKTYIEGFSTAIDRNYTHGALESEKGAVDNYYKEYLGDILTSTSSTAQNVEGINLTVRDQEIINLDSQWQSVRTAIRDKQQLADSYVSLLKKIEKDHGDLTISFLDGKMPSTAQLHQMTDSYQKDLTLLAEKSNKLFKKTTIR